jgi:hypothetical protein
MCAMMQKLRICPGGVSAGSSCLAGVDKLPRGFADWIILADGCRYWRPLLEF